MVHWVKVVERRGQSILISSYFYNGIQTTYFKKTLGLPYGLDHYLIKDYVNYYGKGEVERFQKSVTLLCKDKGFAFLQKRLKDLYKKGDELLAGSKKKIPFSKFSALCLAFGPAMYFPILVEPIIEQRVKEILKKHEMDGHYQELIRSYKPTEGTKELLALHELARHKVTKKQVQEHLDKYAWLSFTKWVGEPWTEHTILERIKRIDNTMLNKDLYQKVQLPSNIFSKEERGVLLFAQELAYFRTYRLDVYTKAGYQYLPQFKTIAKHFGLSLQELMFMTYEEIAHHLKNGTLPGRSQIQRRLVEKWQLTFSRGDMQLSYLKSAYEGRKIQSKVQGMSAYKGKVKGSVRIIRGVLEFDKMVEGAVLVTSMTTPDFVPLMEQASAFVTDEGGITCHAAIVAREMKKPCVIGTKVATKVFKDGDYVEVDADKGIVRLLPKNSQ